MNGTSRLLVLAALVAACGGNATVDPTPDGGSDSGTPPPPPVARLSVSGPQVLDANGAPVVLRGWNWGQWGSAQPQDGADNATQGAKVVRLPLRWWGQYGSPDIDSRLDSAPGHIEPGHLATLDAMMQQAAAHHLWIDLFLDSDCGQASVANDTASYCGTGSDGAPANFMNDSATREKFIEAWEFLVSRYVNQPYIGFWEILPEPQFTCGAKGGCSDWTSAPRFYQLVIPRIRALDSRTPILVGATGGYDLKNVETAYIAGVPNLVYTADFLDFASQTPSNVTYLTDFRTRHGVPVFVQQVGVRQSDTNASSVADGILSALDGANVGWTWWTYRETHASGGGFAPYWQNSDGSWSSSASWLQTVTARF